MSEFSEVVKQLGRICASNFGECDICDLRPFCPSKTFLDKYAKSGRAEQLEEMVMAWAAEHPEPVYETWLEFIKRFETGKPKSDNDFIYWMGTTPISADIAQKLGIEPK